MGIELPWLEIEPATAEPKLYNWANSLYCTYVFAGFSGLVNSIHNIIPLLKKEKYTKLLVLDSNTWNNLNMCKQMYNGTFKNCYLQLVYKTYYPQVGLTARISLTDYLSVSLHLSLSSIASGMSSKLHPVLTKR